MISSSVNNQGVRICYRVEGQGPSLILQHGFSESLESWYWKGFVDTLKQEYQLVLIDGRGHGASDKPHNPEAYRLENYVADIICVLDELDIDKTHYFGYSQGGRIGFGLAKYDPERIRSLIIGGAHPYDQSMALYRLMLEDDLETCLYNLEKVVGAQVPEVVIKCFFRNDIEALRAAYRNDRPDISEVIPLMTMPCMLFAGEDDSLYPTIRRCACELPKATFLGLAGMSHIQAGLKLKEVLSHLIKFLTGTN